MKSVLIALLLVAVLLFVAAEAKRQRGKGKPAGGRKQGLKEECPRNCSDCEEGICRECDDDFVLRSNRFNKTTCEPCGRKLKMKEPALFLQHCVTECSKNCSSCGQQGNCEICQDGFFKVQTRLLQRTVCVRCSSRMKKNWPDVYKKECSGLQECPRNCSDCEEGICRECDDDFVLRSNRFNKTTCEPCGRKLKMKEPALFLQHCVTECSKNCSSCGDNGNCEICQDGFFKVQTRLLQRTVCVRCSWKVRKNWPDVYKKECSALHGCGRNCTSCTMDGVCTECEGDLKLYTAPGSNFTKCVKKCPLFHKLVKGSSPTRCEVKQLKKRVKTSCGRNCTNCAMDGVCTECEGDLKLYAPLGSNFTKCVKKCPLFYKPVKGSSPTRCEVKQVKKRVKNDCPEGCLTCTSGICSECKLGLTPNRNRKRCVKLCSPADPDAKTRPGCEGKAKGKEGKKKRKGGKGKPNRKPTN